MYFEWIKLTTTTKENPYLIRACNQIRKYISVRNCLQALYNVGRETCGLSNDVDCNSKFLEIPRIVESK